LFAFELRAPRRLGPCDDGLLAEPALLLLNMLELSLHYSQPL
jgi:hypothetical protein